MLLLINSITKSANDFYDYFLFFLFCGEIFPLDFENVLGNCNVKLLTTVGKGELSRLSSIGNRDKGKTILVAISRLGIRRNLTIAFETKQSVSDCSTKHALISRDIYFR